MLYLIVRDNLVLAKPCYVSMSDHDDLKEMAMITTSLRDLAATVNNISAMFNDLAVKVGRLSPLLGKSRTVVSALRPARPRKEPPKLRPNSSRLCLACP
jgi:hypothetical protein